MAGTSAPSSFVALMRRYCLDYTNRHDVTQVPGIMEPDYTLRMGQHVLSGRDDMYVPAASAQFRQFPGLCLTVHQIVSNGERLAMRFSEHGRSVKHANQTAAWSGIGLYHWNGTKLTANAVEQDYYSRKLQLDGAPADPIEPPATAPWDVVDVAANPGAEAVARTLLESGEATTVLNTDDAWFRASAQPRFTDATYRVDDIFSAGDDVAFRVVVDGTYAGGLPEAEAHVGKRTQHYYVGVASVAGGTVAAGRIITDRLGLVRRLAG
jgi:predicted ester cyclase